MVTLVICSVLVLLYEVKHPDGHPYLEMFVQFSLIVFVIEYLLRLWIYSNNHEIFLKEYEHAIDNHIPFSMIKLRIVSSVKNRIYAHATCDY